MKNNINKKIILKKSLGQNFLNNDILSEKITSHLKTSHSSNILEIGCGNGALTKHIINIPFKEFHIVELDNYFANEALNKYYKKDKIFIYNEDFLDFEFSKDKIWSIIGNIPYNITYPIIEKLINNNEIIDQAVLMMQEEVAQKLYKTNGKGYGPISVLTQSFFKIEFLERVDPKEFVPQPKVVSRIIKLTPNDKYKKIINLVNFKKILEILFKQPRKKIKNNIVNTILENKIQSIFLDKRAQELHFENFIEISKLI
jgi:16S rRNA (adenine1518-N6/adenine1519-N6)-dimethyltransferase